METKILLSVAFVVLIITGLFWKQLLNVLLLFIPEKKEIHGVILDLNQEESETLAVDSSLTDSAISVPEVINVKNYFITVETEDGKFAKIRTDKSHFFKFKKGEKFDFKVTQPIFSNELVLE